MASQSENASALLRTHIRTYVCMHTQRDGQPKNIMPLDLFIEWVEA